MSAHLLDHPILSERYFFPRPDRVADPVMVAVGGAELACHRSRDPAADAPWLLHFHGNGEVVADWVGDFGPALEQRGLAVFFAEYRGYGGSSGRPALATMLDDALACVDAVGVPPEKIVAYGRSVGSMFALHVAAHRPIAGLILESGIADVHQRLALRVRPGELGAPDALREAVAEKLDQEAKMRAYAGPVLVLHARNDHLVSCDHGEALARWAGERGRLRLFEAGDHNSIHAYNGPAILDEIEGFVASARLDTSARIA